MAGNDPGRYSKPQWPLKVDELREDCDVIEPDSYETHLNQLWYVPEWFRKDKYEFLTLVVDNGMIMLAGQPKEITETKKPFFFVRSGPTPSGQIVQKSLELSFIKDHFCEGLFGKVDPEKDVMRVHLTIS